MADERQYQDPRARRRPEAAPAPETRAPVRPLSEREQARAREAAAIVTQEMPELVPMIKQLVGLDMIHGWRNVFIKREDNGTV